MTEQAGGASTRVKGTKSKEVFFQQQHQQEHQMFMQQQHQQQQQGGQKKQQQQHQEHQSHQMCAGQDDQLQKRSGPQSQQLHDKRSNPQANHQGDSQMIPPGGVSLPLNMLRTGPIMDLGSSPPPVASISGNAHKAGGIVGNGNSIKAMNTNPAQNNIVSEQLPVDSMHIDQHQQHFPSSSTVTSSLPIGPPPPPSAETFQNEPTRIDFIT